MLFARLVAVAINAGDDKTAVVYWRADFRKLVPTQQVVTKPAATGSDGQMALTPRLLQAGDYRQVPTPKGASWRTR